MLWFPLAPSWQSDDFIAVHYAHSLTRALHDFVGNQYGLPGLVWFYRPLITLSFWLDGALAFGNPEVWCWISHLSNVLAHALATVLLCKLATRFLGARAGWCAALIWCMSPAHAGSILWAVGRVDSHATVWILLCALAFVSAGDRRLESPALAVLAQACALCSKEEALVIPGALLVLGYAQAAGERPDARLRHALRRVAPFVIVTGLYLGWRYLLFGRVLGGYEAGQPPVVAMLKGLATWTVQLLDPLLLMTTSPAAWLGLLPSVLGIVQMVRAGRGRVLLACGLLFVGCAVPLYQFWPQTGAMLNARLFYLPFMALVPILIAGGWSTTAPMVLLMLVPAIRARAEYLAPVLADDVHARLRAAAREMPPGPVFAVNLKRESSGGSVMLFHLGVDRLLAPPFGDREQRVFALRPLDESPSSHRPRDAWGNAISVTPEGSTIDLDLLAGGMRAPFFASPELNATLSGSDHLTSQRIHDLYQKRERGELVIKGLQAPCYRITIFFAGGYTTAICPNEESDPAATDGRVALTSWLQSRYGNESDDAFVAFALKEPCTLDLETRFPVWVEAGHAEQLAPGKWRRFERSHCARHFVWLQFDRDYAEWVAGRIPDRKR